MNKYTRLVIFLISFIAFSCNPPHPDEKSDISKEIISVSILPQKYFLEKITGDHFHINVMVPPGFAPENFDPSPRQLNSLSNSKIYLRIGNIGFEQANMKSIEKNNAELKVYDLSKGVNFIHSDHEHGKAHAGDNGQHEQGADPHIWMSTVNGKIIAENVLNIMIENFPADSVFFRKKFQLLNEELNQIKKEWDDQKPVLKGKSFIIYHPALAYLAKEYDMEQLVLEFEGKEPPLGKIQSISKEAIRKQIKSLFIQKQFNTDNAIALASTLNARVVQIDPLDEDWPSQMRNILQTLIEK